MVIPRVKESGEKFGDYLLGAPRKCWSAIAVESRSRPIVRFNEPWQVVLQ
jgi:hypothetical protein